MKSSTSFLLLAACGAGLLSGFAARRVIQGRSAATTVRVREIRETAGDFTAAAPSIPFPRSAETLESLLAKTKPVSYVRLAKWLVDASARHIAAYRNSQNQQSEEITKLIFIHLTRLDPQAALTAAITAGPDHVETAAMGIGEFQLDWLRRRFGEIPVSARKEAVSAMRKWGDVENPMAIRRRGLGGDPSRW